MTDISTDIDRILDYVRERRRAELIEVARALGIRAGDVDKWARLLEREGLIQIEYNLTKMYIIWAGRDSVDETTHVFESARREGRKDREPQKPAPVSAQHKSHFEKFSEKKRELEALVLPKPVATGVANAKAKISEKAKSKMQEDAKAKPKQSIVEEKSEQKPQKQASEPESKPSGGFVMFKMLLPQKQERGEKVVAKIDPKLTVTPQAGNLDMAKANELSLMLKNKVEAINNIVAEISDLKAEREKLYTNEYAPLIARFDGQLSSLSEKLAEREAAVLALKKRIIELPDAVAKTEIELQDSGKTLASVEAEYSRQLNEISRIKGEISGAREGIRSELALSKNTLKACIDALSSVEGGISSVGAVKEQAQKYIAEARKKIDEEQAVVEKMAALVDGSQLQLDELKEMLDGIMERARSADAMLKLVESYDAKLADAEKTIAQVEDVYNRKVAELKNVAETRESEINSLRMEIERGWMQKYLTELNRISKESEHEANALMEKDGDIELRLKTGRERLQQLLNESRELSKKFEESV